jgi:hypothetical protein
VTTGEYQYALRVLFNGKYEMVARLYRLHGVYVCLHEEGRHTQRHHNTNSFGGVDYDVIEQLKDWEPILGRVRVIHREKATGKAWALWADEIPRLGVPLKYGGRHRYFVPERLWQPVVFTDDTYCHENFDIEPRSPVTKPSAAWVPIAEPQPPEPKVDRRHRQPPQDQGGFAL